jgi:hypothetical protein
MAPLCPRFAALQHAAAHSLSRLDTGPNPVNDFNGENLFCMAEY